MFPDFNNPKYKASERFVKLKNITNRFKNLIAPETEDIAELIAYRDNLPEGAWRDQVTEGLDALKAIFDVIIEQGF